MKKGLLALAFGTFGLGIAEFAMMGILPHVATSMHVTIPQAGHLISIYALGVCVGAPLVVLTARRLPLHRILLGLILVYTLGHLLMTFSAHMGTALLARFLSGLPHGAYFGVGSIVADRMAAKGKSSLAIAVMCSGMTVANLAGVPIGTWLSEVLSWRAVFAFAALWGLVTLYYLYRWIPRMEALPDFGLRHQFRFMKSGAPWLVAAGTAFGNGGVFCWYSYISPLMNKVAGFSLSEISLLMILAGASMCIGNLIGGKLSDKFSPGRTALGVQGVMMACLLSIFCWAHHPWVAVITLSLCAACLFAVSAPQQLLLLRCSRGGELMGAAMVQIAFNLGNALGAFCGGIPISKGYTYNYTALVGAGFVILGIVAFSTFCRKYSKFNSAT